MSPDFISRSFRFLCSRRPGAFPVVGRNAAVGAVLCLTLAALSGVHASNPEESPVYLKKIRPLLDAQCVKCHGPEKQKANLRLDTLKAMMEGGDSGPAVVPGDVEGSNLITAICYEDADLQMPPDGKLDEEQIEMLKKWVGEMGG
jgi:hypothetical protein